MGGSHLSTFFPLLPDFGFLFPFDFLKSGQLFSHITSNDYTPHWRTVFVQRSWTIELSDILPSPVPTNGRDGAAEGVLS